MERLPNGVYRYVFDTPATDNTIKVLFNDGNRQAPASIGYDVAAYGKYNTDGLNEIIKPSEGSDETEKPEITNFTAAKESPQPQGTSIRLSVTATGGTGELQYRFYRIKDGVTTVFRDYDNSHIAYSNPPEAGDYILYVDVKDETGKVVTDSIEYKWIKADNPLTIHSFTASVESPQKQGTSVKLTVDADGGEGTLQYRFYRQGNGITTVFRDYAASSTAYCNPPVEGTYILYVDVKDESGVVETYRLLYQWE